MDLASIKTTYDGLKIAKDVFSTFNDLKNEADSISKVNDAVKKVSDAQDTLFELREELFRLQEENNNLKQKMAEIDSWDKRLNNYNLVKTEGGAIVYKSEGNPSHFVCPVCVERKEIQPLQDRRVYSGVYDCPACNGVYPIKPTKGSGVVVESF